MSHHGPDPSTDLHYRTKPTITSSVLTTIAFLVGGYVAVAIPSVLGLA